MRNVALLFAQVNLVEAVGRIEQSGTGRKLFAGGTEACFRTHLGESVVAGHRAALMAFAERMERLPLAMAVTATMLRDSSDPVEETVAGLGLASPPFPEVKIAKN